MTAPKRYRIVYKLTVPTDGVGGRLVQWVTTAGFRTRPTDTPTNTYMAELVLHAGGWSRSVFSGERAAGACEPDYGFLVLNNGRGELDAWVQFAGGGGDAEAWMGTDDDAFPAGYFKLYTARIFSVLPGLETVRVRLQDRMEVLNAPVVTAVLDGTGGLEGTGGGTRKKQLVFGSPGLIPLIEVDHTKQVYFVQANATDYDTFAGLSPFGKVFEGGVPITTGPAYVWADEVVSDVDPTPSTYRAWAGYGGSLVINGGIFFGNLGDAQRYTKGPLYVRLGTPPVGELRFGALGLLAAPDGSLRAWHFTDLCNRAGLMDVSPANLAGIASRTEDFTAGNRLVDADQTYKDVMNDRCRAVHGAFGFNREGKFWCATLRDPTDGTEPSVFTFTKDNCDGFTRDPVAGLERPVWQVSAKVGRTWPAPVLAAASDEMRDLLTRDPWAVQFTGSCEAVRQRYPNALSVKVEIDGNDLKTLDDQRAWVDAFGALYGTQRDVWQLTCKRFDPQVLGIELLDKVTLQLPRYGYGAGVLLRVIAMEVNLHDQTVRFTLWGNNSGFGAWALGGGAYPAGAGEPGGSWGGSLPPPSARDAGQIAGLIGDIEYEFYAAQPFALWHEGVLADFESEWDVSAAGGSGGTGLTWFEAETQEPLYSVTAGPAAARADFLSHLTVSGSEGFEADPPWTLGMSMAGESTTINGVVVTFNAGVIDGDPFGGPVNGRFNTTPAPTTYQWLQIGGSTSMCQMTFGTPITGLGCYVTDMGDFAGQVSLRLHKSGGGTVTHDIAHTVSGLDGALMFVGFFDGVDTYTQVDWLCSTTTEAIGIDDLIVATAAQRA